MSCVQGDEEIDLDSQHEDGATGWLTLFQVTRAHTGSYQCKVDNGISPPAVAEIQLIVCCKIYIKNYRRLCMHMLFRPI